MECSVDTHPAEVSSEQHWPHIARYLRINAAGNVEWDFCSWSRWGRDGLSPAELAASYDEWAEVFEWRLAQRAGELADDLRRRHQVEVWTDNMAYGCRQSAAAARGDEPGRWVPLWERRPDLDATGRAITEEILARSDTKTNHEVDRQLVRAAVA